MGMRMIKSCTYGAQGIMDFMGIADSALPALVYRYCRTLVKTFSKKKKIF
jgi:hypothetical protein